MYNNNIILSLQYKALEIITRFMIGTILMALFVAMTFSNKPEASSIYHANSKELTIEINTSDIQNPDSIAIFNDKRELITGTSVDSKDGSYEIKLVDQGVGINHRVVTYRNSKTLKTYTVREVSKVFGYLYFIDYKSI
jgi:hypothetical protein